MELSLSILSWTIVSIVNASEGYIPTDSSSEFVI